jgi:hypothetical protein
MPTLLHKPVSVPMVFTARSTTARAPSRVDTSPATASAVPPPDTIWAHVSSARSATRSLTTTRAPAIATS